MSLKSILVDIYYWGNKLPQIQQVKTVNIYYHTWFLRVKNASVALGGGLIQGLSSLGLLALSYARAYLES